MLIIQAKKNDINLGLGRSKGNREKWEDSKYILEEEFTDLTDEGSEEKEESRVTPSPGWCGSMIGMSSHD